MLPVVANIIPFGQTSMRGDNTATGHEADLSGIDSGIDRLPSPLAGHRVTVALHGDQTGAGYFYRVRSIAVKWRGHRHHLSLLLLQHLGDAEPLELGMAQLTPQ